MPLVQLCSVVSFHLCSWKMCVAGSYVKESATVNDGIGEGGKGKKKF